MDTIQNHTWLSFNTEKTVLLLIGGGAFLFVFPVRSILGYTSINQYFNVFFVFGGCFAILTYLLKRQIAPAVVVLSGAFFSVAFLSNLFGGSNLFNQFIVLINMSLPLMLVGVRLSQEMTEALIVNFTRIINGMVIIILCVGIPDMLLGGAIQEFMIQHVFDKQMAALATLNLAKGVYRFLFIFGHPLTMAWFTLLFFSLNVINNRYYRPLLSTPVASIMMMAGLVLCNSRTALGLGVIMLLFLNGDRRKALLYFLAVAVFVGSVFTVPVIRNNVVQRFVNEMNEESVSGGRNEAVQMVLEGYVDGPGVFLGKGLGTSRQVTEELGGFINSFEYPLIMYAYDVSVLGTVILCTVIFLIPIAGLCTRRLWLEAGLFLTLSLYLNGFNLLADCADGLVQFCFVTMLFVNVGRWNSNLRRLNAPEDSTVFIQCESPITEGV